MVDTRELLGALLRRGMTDSSASRIEHSVGEQGIGDAGGVLEEELGVSPARQTAGAQGKQAASSGSPLDSLRNLGDAAKSMLGNGSQKGAVAATGLGALLGAIFGGGGKSAKGAMGGGALALLGSIALKALRGMSGQKQPDTASRLAAGLREPENAEEEKEVQSVIDLTVKAMVNAAKADGRIDEDEMQKIVGELQSDGVSDAERQYLLDEVRKPMCTEEIVRAVPNRQVAAQIYAASLLAIEADTPAEQAYLENLANDLQLDSRVVEQVHRTLGVA